MDYRRNAQTSYPFHLEQLLKQGFMYFHRFVSLSLLYVTCVPTGIYQTAISSTDMSSFYGALHHLQAIVASAQYDILQHK